MEALLDGIYTLYENDSDLSGWLSGLFTNHAPQNTAFPYATYEIISGVPIYDTNTANPIEDVIIQFTIFDDSTARETATTAYTYLTAVYDEASLTVSGYTSLRMNRQIQRLLKDPDRRWMYAIDYRVQIEKT